MKRLLLVLILPLLTACPQKHDPVTTCNMTYSCYSTNTGLWNGYCVQQYGYSTRSGSFSDADQGTAEAECVAWEYGFINAYGSTQSNIHPSVSQCQCVTQ